MEIVGNGRTKTAYIGRRARVEGYVANGWHRLRMEDTDEIVCEDNGTNFGMLTGKHEMK